MRDVIRDAGPAEKAATYDELDLKVIFKPGEAKIGSMLDARHGPWEIDADIICVILRELLVAMTEGTGRPPLPTA